MSKCRNMQGVLAAALYEPLEPGEQQALDAHLASCPACQAEFRDMQAMVVAIQSDAPAFEGDLLPLIRENLRVSPARSWRWTWFAASACFSIVVVGFSWFAYSPGQRPEDSVPMANAASPVDQVLAQVEERLQADDATGARSLLESALDSAAEPDDAGRLHLALANLKFDVFHQYAEAFGDYKMVFEGHGRVWSQSAPWVKERLDLLTEAEARDHNFEALYQIESARSQGEAGLPKLEQVMARYPGRFLAREAVNTMVAMVGGQGIEALEEVKNRCSNPIAVAQLDVHLGERYCTDRVNPALGRQMLNDVAQSNNDEVAKMAKDVLAKLERAE